MFRTIAIFFFLLSPAAFGDGGEFLLRIDTVGYEDIESNSGKKDASLLRRIETVVEPGRRFRAKCKIGLEEVEVVGAAQRQSDAGLKISLQYRYSEIPPELADAMQDWNGQIQLPGTSIQTSITLIPGKSWKLSEVQSSSKSLGVPQERQTRTEVLATLIELEADGSHQR